MHRRDFMMAMGGAGLATMMAPAAAIEMDIRLHAVLRVRFDDGEFATIDGFQVHSSTGTWGRDWSGDLLTFNEDRVDLGPGGGLLRQPFRVRWAEARPLGPILKLGSKLVGDAGNGRFAGHRVTVEADDTSWDMPRTLLPMGRYQGRGRRVGTMRLGRDERILVSLNASAAF
jgi:hypothetical protein